MTSLGQLTSFPELVRDSRLDATFRAEGGKHPTIHTQGTSRHAKQADEIRARQKTLEHGAFGSAELQSTRLELDKTPSGKSIVGSEEEVDKNRGFHVRELEAIMRFSQARVCLLSRLEPGRTNTKLLTDQYNGELFIKTFRWFTSESTLCIAMEFFELGGLQKFLDSKCMCAI